MCMCPVCNSEQFPKPDAGKRNYLNAATDWQVFGDATPAMRILLDGQDVSGRCREALLGENGWVILYSNHGEDPEAPPHLCSCGHHACQEVRHGKVELVIDPAAVEVSVV